jgi:NDP-sugar pyrophosphorylase family protein
MDVLILCGGQATRLGHLAADRPKVLMDVNGRPFLEHLLHFFSPHADRVVLLAGKHGDQLLPYASPRLEVVINVLERVSPRFLLANGDTLWVGLDPAAFLSAATGAPATAAVVYGPTGGRGWVEAAGRRAVAFREKEGPPEGLVYAGAAVFERHLLTDFPRGRVSLERVILPRLARDGVLDVWRFEGRVHDIGTPEGLEAFRALHH